MRKLREDEFPPVISRLLGDENRLIVYSENGTGIYGSLIEAFRNKGFMLRETRDLKDEDIRTSSLLILGYESPVLRRLFAESKSPGRGFTLTVRNNPLNNGKVIACANADSPEEVIPVVKKIFHYGKYTSVRFEKGKNVEKETAKTNRGMIFTIGGPIAGVVPKKLTALEEIIDNVSEKPVIFIGERHANYEDHKVELGVIMELFRKGKKLAIGMEMFQKPFQEAIDNYISGKTDEKEFLKKSEYFRRWGLDYSQYREIIEFARAKGIPIAALNLKSEIVRKVASGGLDSLSPEEKKDIPQDMDMSDYAYRERLKNVFESHPGGTKFENFYQSQILWDETMAHSAAAFLREKPDYQLVVLAGVEHIMYGSGIPARLQRLTGREYATLINGSFDEDIGNYVVFAESIKPPFTAKLGVVLRRKNGNVIIEDFSPDSPALKAGMKKGDAVILVDGWKIETVEDVRIALCDKNPYESVQVQVMRKRFLAGAKEIEFHVPL
jgi:aminopeptidase N